MNEHDSLRIIQQMIDTAKQEQKDNGRGWIIWGWMLFTVSVLTVLNMHFNWLDNMFIFWNIFGIITILFGLYEVLSFFFIKKTRRVKTYTKEIFEKLNTGFFICLMFIIVSMNIGGVHVAKGFALLMNLYGFWILIYGTVLSFKPSIGGAYITWVLAFAALFTSSFTNVMLLHAGAVLCGYIIPGHIAHKRFKEEARINSNTGV